MSITTKYDFIAKVSNSNNNLGNVDSSKNTDKRMEVITNQISSLQIQEQAVEKKLNVSLVNETNVERFFSLYCLFFDAFSKNGPISITELAWMRDEFVSVEECPFQWRDLDVHLTIEKIEKTLSETCILQLRPVDLDTKILVIGCGNKPLANGGSYPIELDDGDYSTKHAHSNAITINPHLAHNPTLVGFFGAQSFPMLEAGQFDLIIIEGTSICDTQVGREELERLLSPKGIVVSSKGGTQGFEFTWEDNLKNHWTGDYVLPKVVIEDLMEFGIFSKETHS